MANHLVLRSYPHLIDHMRFVRNGTIVQSAYYQRCAQAMNFTNVYRRKTIGYASQQLPFVDGGASGTTEMWHFYFHTGHNVDSVVFDMLLARADNAGASDPKVKWQIITASTDVLYSESGFVRHPTIDASAADLPPEWLRASTTAAVLPDTNYYCVCLAYDYARPISCLVYEKGTNPVDDTTTGCVDPRFAVSSPILDDRQQDLMLGVSEIWGSNAGPIMCWSADKAADALTLSDEEAYINAWNVAFGATVDDTVASNKVTLEYHNTIDESNTDVPMVIAVYAERTSGAGGCYVTYTDGTKSIPTAAITSLDWYTGTGKLYSNGLANYTVKAKTGASTDLSIHAICVYEYR